MEKIQNSHFVNRVFRNLLIVKNIYLSKVVYLLLFLKKLISLININLKKIFRF